MIYKRTFKKFVHPLMALIYNTIAISIAGYYFSKSGSDNSMACFILFVGWFVIFLIVFSLHMNYSLKSKTIEIDMSSRFIVFDKQDRIYFDQIEKIILVIPPALYRKDPINVSPFDEYHYAEFLTKDGKHYFFTSLLSQNVEEEVSHLGIPLQVKKRLLAYTFL